MPLVEPGRKAPAVALPDQDDKTHRLRDYAGRPLILLLGCTREACAFRDTLPRFEKGRAAVLGVSVLDTGSKVRFARKHELNFLHLADRGHAVADKYGAWQKKSLYGRTYVEVARMTYLIGPDAKVVRRWDSVKVDRHAADVLQAVDAL